MRYRPLHLVLREAREALGVAPPPDFPSRKAWLAFHQEVARRANAGAVLALEEALAGLKAGRLVVAAPLSLKALTDGRQALSATLLEVR